MNSIDSIISVKLRRLSSWCSTWKVFENNIQFSISNNSNKFRCMRQKTEIKFTEQKQLSLKTLIFFFVFSVQRARPLKSSISIYNDVSDFSSLYPFCTISFDSSPSLSLSLWFQFVDWFAAIFHASLLSAFIFICTYESHLWPFTHC